jgi:hypothetical protein
MSGWILNSVVVCIVALPAGAWGQERLRAARDWSMPNDTPEQRKEIVAFAAEIGFDALVVKSPTREMVATGRQLGVRVIAVVSPYPSDTFVDRHPGSLQSMQLLEEQLAQQWRKQSWRKQTSGSYRWHPILHRKKFLCFDDPVARDELKRRVSEALEVADGVALDGFGYRNHYACFSIASRKRREALAMAQPGLHASSVMATVSENALVEITALLYDHAKATKPDAIVMNHVWPPFNPNEYYGHRLKLDFCSQTISWFYKPIWKIQRVAFEAQEIKRLENRDNNRFVPFIGMHHDADLVRSAERTRLELEIALRYGEGNLVWSSLRTLKEHPEVRRVVEEALED